MFAIELEELHMPSPFPGMDPFIESQLWTSFHHQMISVLVRTLGAQLRPRYEVLPEERIYLETIRDERLAFRADIAVNQADSNRTSTAQRSTAQLEREPIRYALPIAQEVREPFVFIRRTGGHEVVAVIELLSPTNKRRGVGRNEYLSKRMELLRTPTHLVEIDLLLGGERMPSLPDLQLTTDYCVFVCRADERPEAEVFEWQLGDSLPKIPVPLCAGDDDAIVDLQAAFTMAYEELGFQFALRYDEPLELPLPDDVMGWIRERVAANQ